MDATEALTKYLTGVTRFSESLPEYEDYRKALISPITGEIVDSLLNEAKLGIRRRGIEAQMLGGKPAVKI